jgi:hypothetical protein
MGDASSSAGCLRGRDCVVAAALAAWLLLGAGEARAATPPSGPFVMHSVRTEEPPPLVATVEAAQWRKAPSVTLGWDFTSHRPASEPTTAYLLYDDRYLYAGCVATQKSDVVATQHTNGVGDDQDDTCTLLLWPSGATGIRYRFTANALGTRWQESSENSTYAPEWNAVGRAYNGGFTVVMRIPFGVMRSDGRDEWRFNFQRLKKKADELDLWATDPGMQEDDEGQFAGYLRGMAGIKASTQTRPRLAAYELAAFGPAADGGSTSRVGADAALPVSRGTSLLATVHPDYSNVELDQMAIQPTEFPRVLQEVRPFFVQGANYYNQFDSVGNTRNVMLYTPDIPTPRLGGAVEGHEAGANFAAFDSVASARTDTAAATFWNSADKRLLVGYQRVSVAQPALFDLAQAATFRYDNLRNLFAYATYGTDRGTNVADPGTGNWEEVGLGLHSATSHFAAALKKIGASYAPVDGITDHPDIAGYATEGTRRFDFPEASALRYVELVGDFERYRDHAGRLDQADQAVGVTVADRNLFALSGTTGSHYLAPAGGVPGLFDSNTVGLTYNQDGATPAALTYGFGRFGAGFLGTWTRSVSFRVGRRAVLDAESDESRFVPDSGTASVAQLERAGLTVQLSTQASFTSGVRRVIGVPPNIGAGIQTQPGTNLSFALHQSSKRAELYVVYGNPNADFTNPVLTVKLIEYIGAQKGS